MTSAFTLENLASIVGGGMVLPNPMVFVTNLKEESHEMVKKITLSIAAARVLWPTRKGFKFKARV